MKRSLAHWEKEIDPYKASWLPKNENFFSVVQRKSSALNELKVISTKNSSGGDVDKNSTNSGSNLKYGQDSGLELNPGDEQCSSSNLGVVEPVWKTGRPCHIPVFHPELNFLAGASGCGTVNVWF